MYDYKMLYQESKDLSVLLVEDFKPLRQEMSEILEDLFCSVTSAENGKDAFALYQAHPEDFDMVISDIQMPQMNGVELTKKIRAINENQSIVILSAHTDSEYLLELINIGIAKFITKPIHYDSLFSYLYKESQKINLYKLSSGHTELITLGEEYYWHRDARILKQQDQIVTLTKHELLLLEFFLDRGEHICTNEEIISRFYQYNIEMSEKNIRNLVFKLRKKIPEERIQSVYGLGYKFTLLDD